MTAASVVVPAHRHGPRLVACLEALRAQEVQGDLTVILALDGDVAIPAGTAALADLVVHGPAKGPAAARNRGWRASAGGHVLFTDSDCVPAPGWAQRIVSALDAGADGVKGAYSSGGGRIVQRLQQVEFEERYASLEPGGTVDMIDTYSCGFRRSALEACNGFDESFPAADHEDVDLSYRMAAGGMRLVFEPEARVEHEHRATMAGYMRLKYSRGRWRARIIELHPSRSMSDRYVPWSLKAQMILCAALPAALAGALLHPAIPAAWAAAFLASCIPILSTALRTDPGVAPLVPLLVLARGFALSTGLVSGAIRGMVR
ncbi:MAG TPA: glycosyltransferase [Candidatus Fermentibacter daniensis]|nr:glycosyltransferase [Candidatus Fermentibacter daniensis]